MKSETAASSMAVGLGAEVRPCAVAMAALELLRRCEEVLGRVDASRYTASSGVLPGGTLGKHVRHTLDHFRAVLERVEQAGEIEYDRRVRNVPMEAEPGAARAAIGELVRGLWLFSEEVAGREAMVRVMVSASGDEAVLRSTLGRELAFATHHAVHHLAMMSAIARELGIEVDAEVGRAPSTVHHERGVSHRGEGR